MKIKKIL